MDAHISELTRNHRFKDAHKALSKRLKKSPNEVSLQISQADLHLATGEFHECKKLCTSLCTRNPPITDFECLVCLYTITCTLSYKCGDLVIPEASNLWQNAMEAVGTNDRKLGLAEEWASQSIKYEQWALLAKAALALQRQMPLGSRERRQYWFWQITAYYLAGVEVNGIERTMAIRLLDKAVKDTPSIPDPTPGLWIAVPTELRLVCQSFSSFQQDAQLTAILLDDRVQTMSADLEVKRLERLLYSGEELYSCARTQLVNALGRRQIHLVDDWAYWSAITPVARANRQCDNPPVTNGEATKLIETSHLIEQACLEIASKLRSPRLARLRIDWYNATETSSAEEDAVAKGYSRIDTFLTYFKDFCTQPFAINDLGSLCQDFNRPDFIVVREHVSQQIDSPDGDDAQLKWLISETLALELDFVHVQSNLSKTPIVQVPNVREVLEGLACCAIRLYRVSLSHTTVLPIKSTEPGDAACMLAIRALTALGILETSTFRKTQVLCLLSFLTSETKHNSRARVEYVRATLSAGLISIAWDAYQGLNIKKVLHEKLSPLMFKGISTLQPFDTPQFSAYKATKVPLDFYEQALSEVPGYQELALQSANYAGAAGMRDFVRRLRSSPTRLILLYERRRIARLNGASIEHFDVLPENTTFPFKGAVTERAIRAPARETADPHLIDHLNWLIATDSVLDAVMGPEREHVVKLQQCIKIFQLLQDDPLVEAEVVAFWQQGTLERETLDCCRVIMDVLGCITAGTAGQAALVSQLERLKIQIEKTFTNLSESVWNQDGRLLVFPPSIWFREVYLSAELCQACHKLCGKVLAFVKQRKTADELTVTSIKLADLIQLMAVNRIKAMKEQARSMKAMMAQLQNADGLVEARFGLDTKTGNAIVELMGRRTVNQIMGEMAKSSQIALDGVARLQIR